LWGKQKINWGGDNCLDNYANRKMTAVKACYKVVFIRILFLGGGGGKEQIWRGTGPL